MFFILCDVNINISLFLLKYVREMILLNNYFIFINSEINDCLVN